MLFRHSIGNPWIALKPSIHHLHPLKGGVADSELFTVCGHYALAAHFLKG